MEGSGFACPLLLNFCVQPVNAEDDDDDIPAVFNRVSRHLDSMRLSSFGQQVPLEEDEEAVKPPKPAGCVDGIIWEMENDPALLPLLVALKKSPTCKRFAKCLAGK